MNSAVNSADDVEVSVPDVGRAVRVGRGRDGAEARPLLHGEERDADLPAAAGTEAMAAAGGGRRRGKARSF